MMGEIPCFSCFGSSDIMKKKERNEWKERIWGKGIVMRIILMEGAVLIFDKIVLIIEDWERWFGRTTKHIGNECGVLMCVCVCHSIQYNPTHTIPHIHSCVREKHTTMMVSFSSHPSSISHNSQQQYNHTSSHIKTHTINHFPHLCLSVCVHNPCWLTNGNQSIIHTIQSFLPPIQNYQSINGWMDVCVECDDCSKQHKHWMWCVWDGSTTNWRWLCLWWSCCLGVVEQMRRMDQLLWMWVICGMMMIECECVFHFNHSVHVIVVNTEWDC